MNKLIKTYESFRESKISFYRFSRNELFQQIAPSQSRLVQYPMFVQILKDKGFPDLSRSIHFMNEIAFKKNSITYRELYGRFAYKVSPKADSLLGWSFMTQINNWWYFNSNQYNYLKTRKDLVKKLDNTGFRTIDLEDATYEQAYNEITKLQNYGLIGFGRLEDLTTCELWGKEEVFIWTNDTLDVLSEV